MIFSFSEFLRFENRTEPYETETAHIINRTAPMMFGLISILGANHTKTFRPTPTIDLNLDHPMIQI